MTATTEEHPGKAQARRLERTYEQLTQVLRQPATAQRLRASPGENEWSVMQTLGHMVEMIPYWLGHCQTLMTASDEPPRFGRTLDSPERLAGIERGAVGDVDELLRALSAEVQTAADAIRRMSAAERDRTGIHPRHGAMTVAEVVETYIVAHAEEHLAQIEAALRA
jgi:uncharacterized damage-inducible protein DinB